VVSHKNLGTAIRHNPINLCANLVMDQESSSSGQESLLNTCSNEISPDHLFVATKYFRKCSLNGCKVHRITRYKQGNRTAKKIKILKTQGPKIQPEAQNTIIK
jgi:hypothetical protein